MREYESGKIRNVVLVGHSGSGKTSLTEAFLYATGATTRHGKVLDGTTVSDFEDEEKRRQISLSTSVIPVEFLDHKLNLLDTPGFTDFQGEVRSAMHVAEAAIVVVDAVGGVEVGTELAWQMCDEYHLPRFVVINKLDRENASFERTLQQIRDTFKAKLIPVQLPIGEEASFKGVVGLLSMKARLGKGDQIVDIPADLQAAAAKARVELMEAAAEGEDALLEKYLGGEELTSEEMIRGFHAAVKSRTFVPVFVASATADIGTLPILEGIERYLPSPLEGMPFTLEGMEEKPGTIHADDTGDLAMYVWKTTADPFVGKVTYFRVVAGVLQSDARVWNHSRSAEERVGTVHVARGKEQISVKKMHAGDIGTSWLYAGRGLGLAHLQLIGGHRDIRHLQRYVKLRAADLANE